MKCEPPELPAHERLIAMKKLIGIGTFVLVFAVPAHGQAARRMGLVGSSSTNAVNGGSGGYGGSLSSGSGSRLPIYPAAHPGVVAVQGGDPSYAPSTFLTFEQAVAEGQAANAAPKSLGEVAAEYSTARKVRVKFAFEQDSRGNVVPSPQQ
jgi:hypothetical protein